MTWNVYNQTNVFLNTDINFIWHNMNMQLMGNTDDLSDLRYSNNLSIKKKKPYYSGKSGWNYSIDIFYTIEQLWIESWLYFFFRCGFCLDMNNNNNNVMHSNSGHCLLGNRHGECLTFRSGNRLTTDFWYLATASGRP